MADANFIPLLVAFVALAGTGLTALFTYLGVRRNADAQEVSLQAQADATASQEWRGLYDEMKKQVTQYGKQMTEMQAQMSEMADELKDTKDLLDKTVERADTREKQLITELVRVYRWIEGGMAPPPPSVPDFLRGLIT